MKIALKQDWDVPIQSPHQQNQKNMGHFVGREKEVNRLVDEVTRKNQGAFLVCGYRGVGKTSFVYKALNSLRDKKVRFIPVIINATELLGNTNQGDKSQQGKEYATQTLISLIRRLYAASRYYGDIIGDVSKKFELLYEKATADEYHAKNRTTDEEEINSETARSFDVSLVANKLDLSTWLTSYVVISLLAFLPIESVFLKVLILALCSVPLIVNVALSYRQTRTKTQKRVSVADLVYSHDNSLGNLLFELEELHSALARKGVKIVYVVDEIDKIKDGKDGSSFFEKIYTNFKNLFTLSSAIFIFVGEEKIFNVFANLSKEQRPPEYTYFTTKYFLARPTYDELSSFLDDITENLTELRSTNSDNFERFKRYLCFKAKGDFFDLVQHIKDHITTFESGTPVIELDGLGSENLTAAHLQKSINVIFERYKVFNPSRWIENEKIIKNLYQKSYELLSDGYFIVVTDTNDKVVSRENQSIKDLSLFLKRMGVLGDPSETHQNYVSDDKPQRRTTSRYLRSGEFLSEVPDSYDDKTQFEVSFVQEVDKLNQLISIYQEMYSILRLERWQDEVMFRKKMFTWGATNPGTDIFVAVANINAQNTAYKREDVENFTRKTQDTFDSLMSNAHQIFSNMLRDIFPEVQVIKLSQNANVFDHLASDIREKIANSPHTIVFTKDLRKQMIIAPENLMDISIKQNFDQAQYLAVFIPANKTELIKRKGVLTLTLGTSSEPTQELMYLREWLKAS